MAWVGTLLLTRGVVFQWASTIKTGRRSDWYKAGPIHTHQHLHTRLCSYSKPLSLMRLVLVATRPEYCLSNAKPQITHSLTKICLNGGSFDVQEECAGLN